MKRYYFLIISSLLLTSSLFGQWNVNMTPIPGLYKINTIFFIDDNTGFVGGTDGLFGGNGVVAKTTNGGASWSTVFTESGLPIWDIFFINSSIGYAVGESGLVARTNNGGANWGSAIWGSMSTETLRSVHFIDQNNGWAAGGFYDQELLFTTNGGNTWVKDTLLPMSTFQRLNDVFFTDANNGFAVGGSMFGGGQGRIYRTTDGGASWDTAAAGIPSYYNDIYFTDANTGFIAGFDGTLIKTTDGGTTWIQQTNNDPDTDEVKDITFVDANTGYACTLGGKILKTTDGGSTWDVNGDVSTVISSLYGISVPSSGVGYTAGLGGAFAEIGPPVSIDDQTNGLVSLYPNPTTGSFKVALGNQGNIELVTVYDVYGRLVPTGSMQNAQEVEIDLNGNARGLYKVLIQSSEGLSTQSVLLN